MISQHVHLIKISRLTSAANLWLIFLDNIHMANVGLGDEKISPTVSNKAFSIFLMSLLAFKRLSYLVGNFISLKK